jgi:hypothetical protein
MKSDWLKIVKHYESKGTFKNIPLLGIATFIGLYIFSSTLYPGGSQADLNSIGFDWIHNYLCNLMNEKGMNGKPNPGRPYAILAVMVLSISLMVFFIQFANTFSTSTFWKRLIIVSGVISMTTASLIFTQYHDQMTIVSSIFGLVVVIGILMEVYKSDWMMYKTSGAVCILLLGVNNYIYYTGQYIENLPSLQKITFIVVLIWIIGLQNELIKKKKDAKTQNVS